MKDNSVPQQFDIAGIPPILRELKSNRAHAILSPGICSPEQKHLSYVTVPGNHGLHQRVFTMAINGVDISAMSYENVHCIGIP